MKNRKLILKRFFASIMVVIMAVTAVPMSGFVGIGLSFRANALSTDANGELVITAGETANVWVESYEITYLKFVPTASGVYTFTSLSYDYDTYGYLYDSDKNQLTYNNDGGSEWNFQITYELRKDTTYYWGVGLRYGDCDSFDVRLSCDRLLCEHENTKDFDTVAASCTTDGCTAGVYCEDCETWLSGHTFIPAHHTYTNTDTVCDVCGEAATEVIYSGDCGADGSNVTFTQYKGGLLVFSGSGSMCNFGYDDYNGCGDIPYHLDLVSAVIIGDGITRIGSYAFDLGVNISAVSIPDSVTEIGSRAFHACRSLTQLSLSDSVVTVGDEAFSECYGLSDLTIGKNVTSIGHSAFSGCRELTSIAIPDSVTRIGDSAFYGCTGLTSLTIGNSVTTIGRSAFYGCAGLTSIAIPDSVTSIGDSAFYGCTGLTSLTIGNSVTTIGGSAFYGCAGLTSIEIPDSVTSIGDSAFYGCTGLTSLTIGKNVATIEESAFSGCTALTRITWNAHNVCDFFEYYYCDDCVWNECGGPHERIKSVFDNAGTSGDGVDVVFGDEVESIPAYAFCGCTDLTSLTIGKNVASIGKSAFSDCTALTIINWNAAQVADLYYYAYDYDEYVLHSADVFKNAGGESTGVNVVFSDNVESIPAYAFYGCTGLTYLTIGKNVTTIGNCAFSGCTALSKIDWNAENVSDFEKNNRVFDDAGNAGGIDVVFDDSVISIPAYAFYSGEYYDYDIHEHICVTTNVKSITIGKNVTAIGNHAFAGCKDLAKINWNAENVSDFECDSDVFYDAGKDTDGIDVVFGDDVESIPAYLFCDSEYDYDDSVSPYTNLGSVTMSGSVKRIGKYAFNIAAKDVSDFEISDNLEKVGIGALDNTPWLEAQPYGDVYAGKVYYTYKGTMPENTSIVIKDGTKGIAGGALASHDNLSSITIPASVTNIGSCAFSDDWYYDKYLSVHISDLSAWCRIDFEDSGSNPLRIAEGLYLNGQEVTDLEIPDGVTEIKDYAFYDFDSFRSVKIPTSVTSIGARAFYNCYGLTTLTIPGSVKTVGNYAFSDSNLSNVSIENSVEKIGERAFYETAVENIILPDSVTEIGREAFENCRSLASVTIGNGVETVPERAFSSCSGLRTIKIGRNLKTVEASAFTGLSNIPEIFFAGSEAEWKNITIDKTNDMILRATMYYNADITHEHSYTAQVTTPATCTQSGVKTFTCDCGRIYTEVIAATGHNPSSWVIDKAATCTADGRKHKQCTACATVLDSETTPASGHSFTNEVTAATCTSVGYETKTCRNCGECHFVRVIPAKGHTPSGWKTDSVREIRYKDCTVCGELLEVEKITECVHRFVSEVTDPTCTANGFELKTCADCGETRFVRVIAAKGHALKTTVTPATQNESGLSVTSCKVCGMITKATLIKRVASVTLSKTAFTYNGKVQTPTVTVKDSSGKVLKRNTDYTVSYAAGRKNPGQYSVKVTFKGNYSGTKTLTFTIAPGTPTLTVTAGAKKATLKWNKQTGATGYVVYMATSKNGTYKKVSTVKGNSAVSYTKTGLTKGKTYYFKVQAYTTLGGKTIYGAYSSVKGAKVK